MIELQELDRSAVNAEKRYSGEPDVQKDMRIKKKKRWRNIERWNQQFLWSSVSIRAFSIIYELNGGTFLLMILTHWYIHSDIEWTTPRIWNINYSILFYESKRNINRSNCLILCHLTSEHNTKKCLHRKRLGRGEVSRIDVGMFRNVAPITWARETWNYILENCVSCRREETRTVCIYKW